MIISGLQFGSKEIQPRAQLHCDVSSAVTVLIQVSSVLDLGLVHLIIDKASKEGRHLLEAGPEVARKLAVSQSETV